MDSAFIDTFVLPFHEKLKPISGNEDIIIARTKPIINEITPEIVIPLLNSTNWRYKMVGTYFVALKDLLLFEEEIGDLLFRSEAVYVGRSYCVALANFGTEESINYLHNYLDFYLNEKKLKFDQGFAMGALAYLDQKNDTNELERHLGQWKDYTIDKPTWNLDEYIDRFANDMIAFNTIKSTFANS
ncbi:MAG: DUF6000 family protein [Balneolaceae bacterium]